MRHILEGIQAKLAELYGPDHYYTTHYMEEELQYSGHIPEWMETYLPPLGTFARILDIGPGYGTLAAYAHSLTGGDVYTVDRKPMILPVVEATFGILMGDGDIERQEMPADELDAVIMTEVLEHFNFRATPTLTKIRKAMVPGGHLFLSTPDSSSKWGKVHRYSGLAAMPEFDPATDSYDNPAWIDGHIWQYSKDELEGVLYYAGFHIKRLDYSHSPGGMHFNVLATA